MYVVCTSVLKVMENKWLDPKIIIFARLMHVDKECIPMFSQIVIVLDLQFQGQSSRMQAAGVAVDTRVQCHEQQ